MKEQHLKRLIVPLVTAAVVLLQLSVVQPTWARSYAGYTDMERALITAGFKVQPASTAAQRNQIRSLPDNQFTEVKTGSNSYYLFPDKRENRLFAGDHYAYRAYLGYIHNRKLREKGVFVWEVRPADRANNKTIEIWHGWTPFPEWSNFRPSDY